MAGRILFVTYTRVGDAVLSTGALDHLMADHPGGQVTVACGPAAAPLFEALPRLEEIIVLEKQKHSMHWLGLWRRCAFRFWDVVVDLRNAPLTLLIPARRRWRMGRPPAAHRVEQMAQAIGVTGAPPAPRIWVTPDHRRKAETDIPPGGPVLGVGPSANWRGKIWPEDRFIELVRRLTGPGGVMAGARVALFGHADERSSVERLIASLPADRHIDLVGRQSLLDAYACLERCACYIGNDSGLMHLAAAAGTPTLGLFGPTVDDLYAPWGAHCRVVRGASPRDSYPQDLEGFDHRNTESLMTALRVDQAAEAAEGLIKSIGHKSPP